MRTCSKCQEAKPQTEYYFNKNLNTLQYWCKSCVKARAAKHKYTTPEKKKLQNQKYWAANGHKYSSKYRKQQKSIAGTIQ